MFGSFTRIPQVLMTVVVDKPKHWIYSVLSPEITSKFTRIEMQNNNIFVNIWFFHPDSADFNARRGWSTDALNIFGSFTRVTPKFAPCRIANSVCSRFKGTCRPVDAVCMKQSKTSWYVFSVFYNNNSIYFSN